MKHSKAKIRALRALLSVASILLFFVAGCGSTNKDSKDVKIDSSRFNAQLTRASDQNEWVAITGSQEWWFFAAGVFRQISATYVEPQFYGTNVACNGEATGTWSYLDPQPNDADNLKRVSLSYNGSKNVTGVCRMTDRELDITLQPSGAVDILDGSIVQRVSFVEKLQ